MRCATPRISRRLLGWAAAAALLGPWAESPLIAANIVPGGFVDENYTTGIADGTSMAFAPDGRIFVCQKGGAVRVISAAGALLGTSFHALTVTTSGERGLLGIAFDPDFSVNAYVYVYYSNGANNYVSRLRCSGGNPSANTSDATESVLFTVPMGDIYHNGGALHFGPDGKLYVGVGEAHVGTDAQNLTTLGGKILRINRDGTIPADNPFYGVASGDNRAIYARGLRNPFTFAIQPVTGRMFVNDVGAAEFEEINDVVPGGNYGWNGGSTDGPGGAPGSTDPIYYYPHAGGPPAGTSITGGTFYNPAVVQFPSSYVGRYFFADHYGNWIYLLDPSNNSAVEFANAASNPVDLDVGPDGALYYLERGSGGRVRRVRYTGVPTQNIVVSTNSLSVAEGSMAAFNVKLAIAPPANVDVALAVSGDPSVGVPAGPLTFTTGNWNTWQPVTVTAAQDDADLVDGGALVTVSSAGLASQGVVVTTLDNDRPAGSPTASIKAPLHGQTVSGMADFYGYGTDNVGTTRADFYVDGLLGSSDVGGSGHYHHGGGHAQWNTAALANGPHVLRMTVSDGTNTASHEITVDVQNVSGGGGGGGGCGLGGWEALAFLAAAGLASALRRRS